MPWRKSLTGVRFRRQCVACALYYMRHDPLLGGHALSHVLASIDVEIISQFFEKAIKTFQCLEAETVATRSLHCITAWQGGAMALACARVKAPGPHVTGGGSCPNSITLSRWAVAIQSAPAQDCLLLLILKQQPAPVCIP